MSAATTEGFSAGELGWGALSFAAPLAVYAVTLARTVTFGDAPALTVAAARLGVGHPPGYPLAALAGQLFTLVPLGDEVRRVNSASAFAAAVACLLAYLFLRRVYLEWRPAARRAAAASAAAAALAWAFGRTFWGQAVITEVYAVHALAVAALLYGVVKFSRAWDPRWGYAAAFFAGLAAAAHFSSFLVTAPAAVCLAARARRGPSPRAVCLGAALALGGFFVYLYLPLRAAGGPAINWGDARTLSAAAAHLLRRSLGGVVWARARFLPWHWGELAAAAWWEFTPAVFVAAAAGAAVGLWRRLAPARFLGVLALTTGPAATILLVLSLRADQAAEMRVWYIPFFLIIAAFAGLALFAWASGGGRWRRRAAYAGTAAALLPLACNFRANDFREYYFAYDYGANLLRTMAYRGTAVFLEQDFGVFELAYLRAGEGRRPDVAVAYPVLGVFADYDWFAREGGRRGRCGAEAEAAFEQSILPLSIRRPIYYNSYRPGVVAAGYGLNAEGLLYRVYPAGVAAAQSSPIWRRYRLRGFARVEGDAAARRFRGDVWLRAAICTYRIKEAFYYAAAGEEAEAFGTLRRLEPVAAGLYEPLGNIAGFYLAHGRPRKAAVLFDRAARAVPRAGGGDDYLRFRYAQLLARKGDAYAMLGEERAAAAAYRAARAAYPGLSGHTAE